jgi:hypothetical protein
MIFWSLWKHRNAKLWEGTDTSLHMIIIRVKVAHYIARPSLSRSNLHIFHDVPSSLYQLIINEMI